MRLRFAVAALAVLWATGTVAQAQPTLYCPPLGVYYPAVPTCPVPWITGYSSRPVPDPPPARPPGAESDEQAPSFRQGAADWRSLQT